MEAKLFFISILLFYFANATIVVTDKGPVKGYEQDGVHVFKGIPFAAPPSGELRWRAPQEREEWNEPLDCTKWSLACPQYNPTQLFLIKKNETSEDCLTLNIWTPTIKSSEPLAVMVWIHGGAYIIGSAWDMNEVYDGTNLASIGNVVVVSIQYRLGVLGFFAHPHLTSESPTNNGNYGIQDCVQALKWVQKNIAQFGGDPSRVTVFGESVGAMTTALLVTLPENEVNGLFHRVITQSTTDMITMSMKESEQQGLDIARLHGCEEGSPSEVLTCLRSKDFNDLMHSYHIEKRSFFFHTGFNKDIAKRGPYYAPTIDGKYIRNRLVAMLSSDKMIPNIDVMSGFNADEASLWSVWAFFFYRNIDQEFLNSTLEISFGKENVEKILRVYQEKSKTNLELLEHVNTDCFVGRNSKEIVDASAKKGGKTFFYLFNEEPSSFIIDVKPRGAPHAGEMQFVFHTRTFTEEREKELSLQMLKYWSSFARTGNPNNWLNNEKPPVVWQEYKENSKKSIEFGDPIKMQEDIRRKEFDLWREILPEGGIAVSQSWMDNEPFVSRLFNTHLQTLIMTAILKPALVLLPLAAMILSCCLMCCKCCCAPKTKKNIKKE